MIEQDSEFHIKCKKGDISRYVILTGDPGRVSYIASFLDKSYFVSSNREFTIYNGYIDGELVTICSHGIGGPSTAICVEELHHLGADTFIRVGTCGGISLDVKAGDIVIATSAIRYDHTSLEYVPIEFPAVSDFNITMNLVSAANEGKYNYHLGIVQCKDSFYGQHYPENMPVKEELFYKWNAWKRLNVLASEMESSTLFVVSSYLKCRSSSLFNVVWNQERQKELNDFSMMEKLEDVIKVAIEGMKKIIKEDKK